MKKLKTASKKIFNQLNGTWKLNRTISDYGLARGVASFVLVNPHMIHYIEEVEVIPHKEAEKIWKAKREYFYLYNQEKDIIEKLFDDKRIFCELSFIDNVSRAGHLCSLDNYEVHYNFLDRNQLNIQYQVTGPNKNYIIETKLIRI